MKTERVYALIFASVSPHYVKKVESKRRTVGELDEVIRWLKEHLCWRFRGRIHA